MLRSLIGIALVVAPLASNARIAPDFAPVYREGSEYTTTLNLRTQRWNVDPLVGAALDVQADALCPRTTLPPKGLWIVGRDAAGRPELVAPSTTALPLGHSGRVALRACDDPELNSGAQPALGVPATVLQRLATSSGAVLVEE